MKLSTLAIAIAAATVSVSAHSAAHSTDGIAITGDITVGYFGDATGNNKLAENGSEVNLDASATSKGGVTYYAHTEVDFQETGNAAQFQEVRVGAKGAFGEVIFGEADNGCDQLDVGGYPDQFLANNQGGCAGDSMGLDANNMVYLRTMGAATVAVSHNPNDTTEHSAIGVKGVIGPVTASLGYESGDDLGGLDKNVTLGLSASLGAVTLGLRANDAGSQDGLGVNAAYSAGANTIYGGFGEVNDVDRWAVGYNRNLGGNTTFIVEAAETDGASDTEFGIGLKHTF